MKQHRIIMLRRARDDFAAADILFISNAVADFRQVASGV